MAVLEKVALLVATIASAQTVVAQQRVMTTVATKPPYVIEDGPLVSVIIPTLEEENYLPALLAGLANQTYGNLEVIVVDNHSNDNTVQIARNSGAFVVFNEQYNISMSRNLGAKASYGSILVFIDADTIPEASFIEQAVQKLSEGAIMVSPSLISTDNFLISLGRLIKETVIPRRTSACLAVAWEDFQAVGGFDETCLPQDNCSEEENFIRRLEAIGTPVWLTFTYAGTSSRRLSGQGFFPAALWEDRAYRLEP
jgi:glycosyltransferase involved in cell wall biosynthesis